MCLGAIQDMCLGAIQDSPRKLEKYLVTQVVVVVESKPFYPAQIIYYLVYWYF